MFFLWFGRRLYGRIERIGGVSIATLFAHVYGLPLIPQGTRLVVRELGTRLESIPLPPSARSIAAGYLRIWGIVGAMATLVAVAEALPHAGALGTVGLVAVAIASPLPALWAWLFAGRLSRDEVARRCVYARFSRVPCDPVLLGESRRTLAERLRAHLAERAAGTPIGSYRAPEQPVQQWRAAALDPTLHDADFLAAAFTLARLEEHEATDAAERAALGKLSRDIWARLSAEHRAYVEESCPKPEHRMSRTGKLALAAAGAAVAVGGVGAIAWVSSHTAMHIVNASSNSSLSILVDGEVVQRAVPRAATEDAFSARTTYLAHGEHDVEARDAEGHVVDRAHVKVGPETESLLYVPAHDASTCFVLETAVYGRATNPLEPFMLLDPAKSLVDVGPPVDVWFGELPSSVTVDGDEGGAVRRAVRQLQCPADAPAAE